MAEADCCEHAEGGTLHSSLRVCGGRQHLPSVNLRDKGTILPRTLAIKSRGMSSATKLCRRGFLASIAALAATQKSSITRLVTRKYTITNRDYLFVEIETDGGITGIGEGSMSGRVDIVEAAINWFKPYIIGTDPGGIEDHWNRAYYEFSRYRDGTVLMTALAAVDLALWDIEGKRLGLPVWRLTGASEARPM